MTTDFTAEQLEALEVARTLVQLGCPLFVAKPDSMRSGEFHYPRDWQAWRPRLDVVDRWRPGDALCMVTGVVYDVIDVDPRNGGAQGIQELATTLRWDDGTPGPESYAQVATPSEGEHIYIGRTGLAKSKPAKGVDLQAGDWQGEGRGFVFLPPTVRPSKYGPRKGELVPYRWVSKPAQVPCVEDGGLDRFREHVLGRAPARRILAGAGRAPAVLDDDDPFDGGVSPWTPESADRVIRGQLAAVVDAVEGTVNATLGGAARMLGRFVAGGYLDRTKAEELLLSAIETNPVHSDYWNMHYGRKWTAASVIASGMAKGEMEPYEVHTSPAPGAPLLTALPRPAADKMMGEPSALKSPTPEDAEDPPPATVTPFPRLRIESAATMAYWLQQEIGQGTLSGFFARQGVVVHTPRVGETGYVEPKGKGDDNGPAEIRPVTADILAAKLQFLHYCYKDEPIKDPDTGKKTGETREVPALFPTAAAKAVVNAPEALSALRSLRGVTHTPMVRADGTVLTGAGYDDRSGYLYLPPPELVVPGVPDVPNTVDLGMARGTLLKMIEDFPFGSDDDRANYLGLLLTPLLRELAPPSYKMFGIGAHQPGSGKSLLAEIAGKIHGWVFRSDVPEDEAEWRKSTASILATTSAPLVVIDNVSGVLRSSVLAGLLTASGDLEDRELGRSTNLRFRNDRVWLVTGNNLSLGGDLVRRTITVMIDPNMANPETRTDFAIPDLPRWVDDHRGDILWSLLVLVRHWVAEGMPLEDRRQSDGFAYWEKVVGGILAAAGVEGRFDAESGKRAAAGGDDDGLSMLLEQLYERYGDKSWSVAEMLAPRAEPGTGFIVEGAHPDWLPGVVLDRLSRSEASGKQMLGHWLRNRIGRWVSGSEGGSLVLREAGKEKHVARWKVEHS
jgi:hypothetical protein